MQAVTSASYIEGMPSLKEAFGDQLPGRSQC